MYNDYSKLVIFKNKALDIIYSFPVSFNWHHFLKLKSGKKVFFSIFIKKYWLDWSYSKYSWLDIMRRIRVIEFFDCMLKDNDIKKIERGNLIIESKFHRMVIAVVWKPGKQKLEMISFYHYL